MKRIVTENVTNSSKVYTPVSLLKFGQEQHLIDLLENGTLYVSSIQELRKGESSNEYEYRYDTVEGATAFRSFPEGTITGDFGNGKKFTVPFLRGMYYEHAEVVLGNVCSFYGINTDCFLNNELIPIDDRMKTFGTHFIFIRAWDEFLKRVDTALRKLKLSYYYGFVEYFDDTNYDGKLHLFHKRKMYEFQNEFRIYVKSNNKTYMKLKIGSIKDIAGIAPADTIGDLKMNICLENNNLVANSHIPISIMDQKP